MPVADAVSVVRLMVRERLGVRVPEAVPKDRPGEFVVVGWGPRTARVPGTAGVVDSPQVEVWCWAATQARARELAEQVSDLMAGLHRSGFSRGITSAVETSRAYVPDPETGTPRWHSYYMLTTFSY